MAEPTFAPSIDAVIVAPLKVRVRVCHELVPRAVAVPLASVAGVLWVLLMIDQAPLSVTRRKYASSLDGSWPCVPTRLKFDVAGVLQHHVDLQV